MQLLFDRIAAQKERNLFSLNMSEKWNHYFLLLFISNDQQPEALQHLTISK